MSGYLLDTCLLSELKKKDPSPQVLTFFKSLDSKSVFISVITIGELAKGIGLLPVGHRRADLEIWLSGLEREFERAILPVTTPIAQQWGELLAKTQLKGHSRPAVDTLIAATAIRHGLKLVTRNVLDFKHLDLSIINPWEMQ